LHRLQDAGRDTRAANGLSALPLDQRAEISRRSPQRGGRFAPTPSGALHSGSLVAALASRCDAIAEGYAWQVRIDDIDPPRIKTGAIADILKTLRAFGFQWDGEVIYQSDRSTKYQQALQELIDTGCVFRCYCTRRQCGTAGRCIADCRSRKLDLADERAFSLRLCVLDQVMSHGGIKDGAACGGNVADISAATGKLMQFEDRICGQQTMDIARSLGDIILRRRDGLWSYAMACACDDSDGISDVVRGADLLEASFAQLSIMRKLGRSVPQYAHLPIAQDDLGRKLGKQTGAAAIDAANPLPALIQAWHFLGQSFNHSGTPSTLDNFWKAVAHDWSIQQVPESARLVPNA